MARHRNLRWCVLAGLAMSGTVLAAQGVKVEDIKKSADPCDNFFEFANGNWREQHPIPASMDRWSRRWESGETNKANVRGILDDLAAQKDLKAGTADQLAGDFYASCMNEDAVNQAGMTPIKPWLADIDAIKSKADLEREIGRLHEVGVAVPFAINSGQDLHEPTKVIAHFGPNGLGLPDRDYYLKPEQRFVDARAGYLKHVAKMFELAGSDAKSAAAAADTVFAFEKRLAEDQLDNVALRDPAQQDHKTSFADLKKQAPHFGWDAYFAAAKIPTIDLNVSQPKYLARIDAEFAKTDLAQWKTYLRWQALNAGADTLGKSFVDEHFAFYGAQLAGKKEQKPRWKTCVEATDGQLGEALGQKYVEKYFPPAAKARMTEMVKNILGALGDDIKSLSWMSDTTKKKALEKLSTINPKIGYPDKWKSYAGVKVGRGSYWDNQIAASRWNIVDDRSQIGKPVDPGRWGMTPPTSNAYYNPLLNEIVFPAGILQPPGFSLDATDAVNYGSIGVVIGHEVSHGFDDQGAQFDAAGRLSNWWTPEDLKQFQSRGQCVVDQFDNYFIEKDVHHNGKLVLGESIGDLGGAKLAWLGYQRSRQGKDPEPTIDGYTPAQQFFIAWGQWRGDAIRIESQRLMIQGDPHPTGQFRVNGPLSNLKPFQDAFQCKADAPMVRQGDKRCEIW